MKQMKKNMKKKNKKERRTSSVCSRRTCSRKISPAAAAATATVTYTYICELKFDVKSVTNECIDFIFYVALIET